MAMPQTNPWTPADLDRFPDDGNRYEVVDGELLVTPPPSDVHEEIGAWLTAVLVPFVTRMRLGFVYHPRSVVLIDGSQVEPDLMVRPIRRELDGWASAPLPILVVEIASTSSRRNDTIVKRDWYLRQAIPEYWIVDRYTRTVIRYADGRESRHTKSIAWEPRGASEPLSIDLERLWAETQNREVRL